MNERLEMKYFVLKPGFSATPQDVFEEASRRAMGEYARTILPMHPEFAADINRWLKELGEDQEGQDV